MTTQFSVGAAQDEATPVIVGPLVALMATVLTLSVHGPPYEMQGVTSLPPEHAAKLTHDLAVSRDALADGEYYRVFTCLLARDRVANPITNLRPKANQNCSPQSERCPKGGSVKLTVASMTMCFPHHCISQMHERLSLPVCVSFPDARRLVPPSQQSARRVPLRHDVSHWEKTRISEGRANSLPLGSRVVCERAIWRFGD